MSYVPVQQFGLLTKNVKDDDASQYRFRKSEELKLGMQFEGLLTRVTKACRARALAANREASRVEWALERVRACTQRAMRNAVRLSNTDKEALRTVRSKVDWTIRDAAALVVVDAEWEVVPVHEGDCIAHPPRRSVITL